MLLIEMSGFAQSAIWLILPVMDTNSKSNRDTLLTHFMQARTLLLDALDAGKYLHPGTSWEPHHSNAEKLRFRDRTPGGEQNGLLVFSEEITGAIMAESTTNDFSNYIVVGTYLGEGVRLGHLRAERVKHVSDPGLYYWATFVFEGSILVTLGNPSSACKLIGEILDLQLARPFVQSRVCSYCHAINPYASRECQECGKPILVTGRLSS
jgi:hypothetical protein